MRRTIFLALLCSLLFGSSAFAGSISGTITFDSDMPKLRPVKMDADPDCAKKHSSPVFPEFLAVGNGNGLANVFVQVKNAPASSAAVPTEPVVIDQKGCRYIPHVAGVMAGQPLLFKNSDGILHNVHGLPKENREFNIGMPPTLKEKVQTLNKPEPVFKVKCDVHPWMNSYVAVMSHPYFSVSSMDGKFEIGDVPDGTYTIEAWHEKLGTQTAEVKVSGGAATSDFSFKAPPRKK